MIAYFPDIYEDELVYSIMCRLYLHLGIPSSCIAKKYIYGDMTARVDAYGIGHLQPYVMEALTKRIPEKELILKHTMFAYLTAFDSILNKQAEYSKAVRGENIYGRYGNMRLQLKYCPICAREDAIKYGEAYYHRKHQLTTACIKHRTKIKSIDVAVGKRRLLALIPLEQAREENFEIASEEDLRYSAYVDDFMENYSLMENDKYFDLQSLKDAIDVKKKKLAVFKPDYESKYGDYWMRGLFRDVNRYKADTILKVSFILGVQMKDLFK